jgi:outer membrane protein TolC
MSERFYLVGVETVQSAASQMASAAEQMRQSASQIEDSVRRLEVLIGDGYGNLLSRLVYQLELMDKKPLAGKEQA